MALSLATAAVTLRAQASQGATAMLHDRAGLPLRLANAAIAYAKYLAMTIWPADLAVYYPYDLHPSPWQTAGAAVLLLALTGGALWCLRRAPYLAVGWFWYVGTLVPVIGLVQVGSQALADRYCYIPSIGLFLALVWGVSDLARWLPRISQQPKRRIVLAATGSAILAAFLVAAHLQVSYWANSERLFRHALAITGENSVACENLGDALLKQARSDDLRDPRLKQEKYATAEGQFRKVLAGMDAADYYQAPWELAQAMAGQGRIGEAIAWVHETIPETTHKARAMYELAHFLVDRGNVTEAIRLLQEAIELAPEQPAGLKNLAWIYAKWPDHRFHNAAKAVELARRACELSQWKDAPCRQTLADAYLEAGDTDRAVEELPRWSG